MRDCVVGQSFKVPGSGRERGTCDDQAILMSRRKSGRQVNGWLNLDKPPGMTSTQAVNVVKRMFQARKAGHAGTLDPLATGVLPIAFGEATKTINFAVDSDKSYRFIVRWGEETTTDDSEGEIVERSDRLPLLNEIEAALQNFIGEIEQVPPRFSAIKVGGQRAYDLAREGAEVELAARMVMVHDLRAMDMPDRATTLFEARCGKGTYVRAIARDLGRRLGSYGHIVQLRRTRVGPFDESEAVTLNALQAVDRQSSTGAQAPTSSEEKTGSVSETVVAVQGAAEERPQIHAPGDAFLRPVAASLEGLDEVVVASNDASRIRRGQAILLRGRDAPVGQGRAFATMKGQLIALGEVEAGSFIPTRVFNL